MNMKSMKDQLKAGTLSLSLFILLSPLNSYAMEDAGLDQQFVGLPQIFKTENSLTRLREAISSVQDHAEIRNFLDDKNGHGITVSQRITGNLLETTKFQHYYKGIEVFGSMAFHHRGFVSSEIRNELKSFDLDLNPAFEAGQAAGLAQSVAGFRELTSEPQLKILPSESGDSARLVYWVDLEESGLDGAREMIIDAHSGEIIGNLSKHLTIAPIQVYNAKNQGVSVEPVVSNAGTPMESLKECKVTDLATGKTQVVTAEACNRLGQSSCQILVNGDPVMVNPKACPQAAPDRGDASAQRAYRNSQTVLSYFQNSLRRNSFDNRGSALVSVVHAGQQYSNAHWDIMNKRMVYGDGDGVNVGDFTLALDVAGHEMTHGVTSATSKLLGMGESGALNEAYSDFFGVMASGAKEWAIGRKLFLNSTQARGVRDLAEPHNVSSQMRDASGKVVAKPHPKHVKEKWVATGSCDGSNDNCWVHMNATLPGHASYLVYKAIGQAKAEKLYYTVLTQALSPREDIKGAAATTMRVCSQMFDALTCGKVKAAFAQVGL